MDQRLWAQVVSDFPLGIGTLHGPSHWVRVERNGLYLADKMGLHGKLVSYFALFHDCQRINESVDDGHGRRGAEYIDGVIDQITDLSADELELLKQACAGHTDQHQTDEPFFAVCWDADRLDLGRVGSELKLKYFNTQPARDMVAANDFAPLRGLPVRHLDFVRRHGRGE
jgi:uncharacterized protein